MREKGVVTRISGDEAAIRMSGRGACEKCGLCRAVGGGTREMVVKAPPGLVPGDPVAVIVTPQARLRSVAVIFFLPLTVFILALLAAERFLEESVSSEAVAFLIGAVAACIAFAGIAFYDRRLRARGVELVRIEKVEEGEG